MIKILQMSMSSIDHDDMQLNVESGNSSFFSCINQSVELMNQSE